MTTAAQDIHEAIRLMQSALHKMQLYGAQDQALYAFESLIYELQAEESALPVKIHEEEDQLCKTCQYYEPAPSEDVEPWNWCQASSAYSCPVVRNCGWPVDLDGIPNFLKKQAS